MAGPLSKLRRKFKSLFRKNRAVVQLGLIIGVSALALWAIYLLTKTFGAPADDPELWRDLDTRTTDSEAIPPLERDYSQDLPNGESPRVDQVIARALAAYGQTAEAEELVTLRRRGALTAFPEPTTEEPDPEPLEVEASFFWKAPNLVRYSLKLEGRVQRFTFNGDRVWMAVFNDGQLIADAEQTGQERELFIRNSLMSQPVVRALQRRDGITLQGTAKVGDRECYLLRLERVGYAEEFYLDQKSFLCLRQRRLDKGFDNTAEEVVLEMEDFREVDGRVFAFLQTVKFDGRINSRFEITQLDLNTGIVSSAFDPPVKPESRTPGN